MFSVLQCSDDVGNEIIKSTIIKSLIQINRSSNKSEREIVLECAYYVGLERRFNLKKAEALKQLEERLRIRV